jgi:hypothetical protein
VGVPQHFRAELRFRRHMRHVAPLSPVASLDCAYFPSPRGCTLSSPLVYPELRGATFLSPLECADPKSLAPKSFGMNRSKKYRGEGVECRQRAGRRPGWRGRKNGLESF